MAKMTLTASNYNKCQQNNYDILNEYGSAVGSDEKWNITTSNKLFKIRAKDNYSFNPSNDETPLVDFSGFGMSVSGVGTWYCTDYTLTYNDDYTEITVNLVSGDIYDNWGSWSGQFKVSKGVKATPIKALQTFTITENLTNATSDNTDTTILEGTNKTITFSPSPSNYRFDTTQSQCNTGEFLMNVESQITWNVESVDTNVEITVVAQPPINYYNVTNNLTNVSADENNPVKVEENTNFTLVFHANNGYKINTITCNIGTVVISDDKLTATITGVATKNISVVATGKKIHYVYITGELNNCTCNYENGEEITTDKILTITANSGYTFKGVYTYKNGSGSTKQFSKNNEQTVLTIDYIGNWNTYNIELNDNYNATKISELVSGFVNLYRTNNSELMKLSKARFVTNEGSTVDYGEFITQLYVLPFTIPNDIIGDKGNIILGNYDSKVESTLITDSKLYIDGGTITVPNKYNNVYDYLNTTCTLRLPYFNPIIIDVDNVINKTLTIQFIVDLYSGNCTATITSSFTGEIIHSETTNIVTQIPFIQKQNNSIVNRLSNVNENLIDTSFIEITRNIPYYANDIFGKATIVFDTVGSVTGYCEISDIQLITTATNEEKEEIESILKDGIFIKESEV